jgi:hypothetical protein
MFRLLQHKTIKPEVEGLTMILLWDKHETLNLFLKIGHIIDALWNRKSLLGVAKSEAFVRERLLVRLYRERNREACHCTFPLAATGQMASSLPLR